ncbi:hypothetical protein [Pseudomonas sp. AB12(2023)]|uniref:hypothetical protein n=1 Tax=Pseudomonas sp. AB12(2023) TaxID=3048597 RepID=UPI002B23BA37|nr:hypothetical protein [Pseudomonas sp. AB12(2023)]MEB0222059.1 hypothetical protein [Pseudomonas sp. AB12(2023)]
MKEKSTSKLTHAQSTPNVHRTSDPDGPATHEKQNKTIRIRKLLNGMLAEEAFARTRREGKRVNESDIIDEALEAYFGKKTN